MRDQKIKSFRDLIIWQKSHRLTVNIYNITKDFPKEEKFGLIDQMRRAAVSVGSNIAEGFGRETINDKCHFYTMALGSLFELQNQLSVSKDVGYLNNDTCGSLFNDTIEVNKMCTSLIKSLRKHS